MNGHKKIIALAAGIAALCSILSFVGGTYNGWTQNVEASVIQQRMVNAHDETLKAIVPKVEVCHEVNLRQEWGIEQNSHDVKALAEKLDRLADKMDLLIQQQMREGRIPR